MARCTRRVYADLSAQLRMLRRRPISNPTNTVQTGSGPVAVLRRAKSIKNASDAERKALLDDADRIETWCAWSVLSAIVLEAILWISPLGPFLFKVGNFLADAAVGIGIYGELRFGHVIADIFKILLAEATERAAKADLARVELESRLAARTLNEKQFNILKKLKDKVPSVIVASDVDAETAWFGNLLAIALREIGLEVGLTQRGPHVHSSVNFICDTRAFANPDGEPTGGEPLASVLNEAGIPIGGIVSARPQDISEDKPDVPMIVIGGRFTVPPQTPYLGENVPAPPVTMLERMRNP